MSDAERDRRFASTLAKGLQVMQAFKPGDVSLGNRELARRTGMPPSTVARMTFTLASMGFLEQLHPSEAYRLGPSVMALGYTARAGLSFLPMAENVMQQLADDTGVLVALSMRHGDAAMLTRCWRPRNASSLWLSEGHRLPMEQSAPGRAILAADPTLVAETEQARADREQLESRGYVISYGGWNSGVNACAVPFQTALGTQPFAFLCGANASDLNTEKLERVVAPRLRDTVQTLRHSLGYM
ncbi:HTH-type transcriptional regulator TsaQ1/TsaQ2 [Ruegeria sp. THAF57]|uniref:IclR family transcriptional regulator n=1 Tax=Ruegeria sp. THAF57 TaxID=2744555 RepID=UPI0015DE024C|nr:IclR family transcriptional regulator [Ruegeria sp. THAF57]CAD0186781.1 HTH-type transcriptional regulator TsaQ1/TsaQ2 [Ruegeria sp. THAF57]